MKLNKQDILKALESITVPGEGKNMVESGAVKNVVTFADEVIVDITISILEFKGVKLRLKYEMRKQDGQLACEAYSEHCFLNREGKFIRMQKEYPDLYQLLCDLAVTE